MIICVESNITKPLDSSVGEEPSIMIAANPGESMSILSTVARLWTVAAIYTALVAKQSSLHSLGHTLFLTLEIFWQGMTYIYASLWSHE